MAAFYNLLILVFEHKSRDTEVQSEAVRLPFLHF